MVKIKDKRSNGANLGSSCFKEGMAESVGISTAAIDKNIVALKKKGLLRRISPARGGHWDVVGKWKN